jgi:DNA polymerase/3'-5' exonuclease PolX
MDYSFMLAQVFEIGKIPKKCVDYPPPEGWVASEKFDGYRCQWRGKLISRANKVFEGAPEWFLSALPPNIPLDGELWVGRENFQSMGVVRKKAPEPEEWIPVKYVVYDLPDEEKPFEERIKLLQKIVKDMNVRWNIIRKKLPVPFNTVECPLIYAKQTKINSYEQMDKLYKSIIQKGGEGIMLKNPKSFYEKGRSVNMLKVKPSFDVEAVIVDYTEGKGKYKKMLGGFECKPLINMDTYHVIDNDEKHEFTTSGMDDEIRENYKDTHPIGTVITITHNGYTDSGKPRFARYLRKRDDVVIKEEVDSVSHEKRDKVIEIFNEISNYEKANGQAFKASSYKKVIVGLRKLNSDIELTEFNIKSIKGVGDSLYLKINDILTTGTCSLYEKIKDIDDPRKMFLDIHGVGPKKANELVKGGFKTIEDLRAIENKSEVFNDVQIMGLNHYEDLLQRIPREEIVKHEKLLKNVLSRVDKTAELTIAGSYRRKKNESGDIDVLLKADDKTTYEKFIKRLTTHGYLIEHLAHGNKKYNGISKVNRGIGRRIDIMYTKPSEYPFAILYFTGSDDFNKMMRKMILDKGMSINEYSLKDQETKKPVDHVFKEEKDIFDYLGMEYVEPCQRM